MSESEKCLACIKEAMDTKDITVLKAIMITPDIIVIKAITNPVIENIRESGIL